MIDATLVPWVPQPPAIISDQPSPREIVQRAIQLNERDQKAIVLAFESGAYEMATSFVWSRALAVLKKQLATLGMEFVGEMLSRPDLKESSNPMTDLREDEAIEIAEQLGMITTTETLRLRNSQALVNHFLDPDVSRDEQMYPEEAVGILRSCVLNFLVEPVTNSPGSFLHLRHQLESETLSEDSPTVQKLGSSPYFFLRTTLTVLLTQLRTASGAKLEHTAGNLITLLPVLWPKLRDKDRWQTGETFALVHAFNRPVAVAGLRQALMRVKGLDFVPETLRSETYRSAARAVLDAHFAYNNFHNEPKPMHALANLGSSIPGPALSDCFTAVLCVRLGNAWGFSRAAQDDANRLLKLFRPTQWQGYFNRFLPGDRHILEKLALDEKPLVRWQEFLAELNLSEIKLEPRVAKLVTTDPKKRSQVKKAALTLRNQLMQVA